MNHNILRFLFIVILSNIINPPGICQSEMPDVLQTGKLNEQLNYIEERTKIYEYYRAIREDMFQQIKKNTLDSLAAAKTEIITLTLSKNKYNIKIDSLNKLVNDARSKLDEAVRTKNNIKVVGIDVNKFAYNSVMWIIVAGLAALLTIGFLVFKRNLAVTRNTRKDLEDLKTEFEAYRKQSREAREKMSMEHFKEIKKLKAHVSSVASSSSEVLTKETAKLEGSELRAEIEERRDEIPQSGSSEPRAEIEERSLTNEVRKSRETGDEIPQSGSAEQRTEAGEQGDEIPESGNSELRSDDEEPKSKSDSKKPRKRRTQSSEQGSIEL